jgi:2,3-bisphosphoglycerate-dependent phosphoglycerate mutase
VTSWLAVVRHGESTGNVAMRAAMARGLDAFEIPEAEADVPLSPRGHEQAAALGRRLALSERPTVVLSSPYLRAVQTARIALPGHPIAFDERLRDRDMGRFHGLTPRAAAARGARADDLHYRPPGGESWADVAQRLGAVLAEHPGGRVLVFAHDAIVMLTRYIVERRLLDVAIANASISLWSRENGRLRLVTFNSTDHLRTDRNSPTVL